MKRFLLIYLLLPIFFYSQNSSDQVIKEKIEQLNNLQATNRKEEKSIISLSHDLYNLSKKAGNKLGMMESLKNLSIVYLDKGEVNECLKIISEAIALAEDSRNYKAYTVFQDIKGGALLDAGNYAESRICFSKALKGTELIEDKTKRHVTKSEIYQGLLNYAHIRYNQIGKAAYKDSIVYFAKKSYEEILEVSEKEYPRKKNAAGQAARVLGEVYINHSDYREGEKYLNISEELLINSDDIRIIAGLYNAKGNLKFHEGDNKKALEYYEKALQLSKKIDQSSLTSNIYENFIQYYKKNKDVEKELYYTEISKKLNDSLSKIHKDALITQSREDLFLERNKQESRYNIWLIAVAGIAVSLVGAYWFYFQRKKNKTEKLSETKAVYHQPQKDYVDQVKLASLLEMAKSNDRQFLILFQEVFANLYSELLKFSELTSADLEMCAYLKLNIQTKEIATYKKVSIGAVDNRKYRIRKKLNLLPETDLYKWINTI